MKNKHNPIMDREPARDSFILYAKWYTCISAFSAKAQGLAFKAICEYALFDIPIPKVGFSNLEYSALISFLPILDSNRKKYENGQKGAVHGSKGGRPRKEETPKGILNETPKGYLNQNRNENDKSNLNKNVDAIVSSPFSPPSESYVYNLVMPIFFFRNCNANYEVRRFYKHYRLSEWRLSGGDLLDTPMSLKIAAERWKVEDAKPFYPPSFISIWRDIYEMAPAELKQDVLEISSTIRMQSSITILCTSNLHQWLSNPEIHKHFAWLQQNKTSQSYRIDVHVRKEK